MAHIGISDEELLMLLSPAADQPAGELEKPKLTMKLLYELIKKLKQENIQLSERVAEYELKLDILLQTREEVASSLELPAITEPETAMLPISLEPALPQPMYTPRSKRHVSPRKQSIGALLVRAFMKLFARRRRGYPSRYRSLF
ncbi:hypothetical protein ACFPES_25640 [Paenibacillus sp. GCM10023248]|uniref:hypothetical protein n=1 Tax=Bacillales TaxID=1385 RepID=UPI00237805E8|nr:MULTISPECIES: hypothetical protein [Bacillales]MDD9270442.1 hypothetical protein [Paenibacillus sp. MAHUQ-63]MDR6884191.1 hypothetical protein [Bacillus sp. 3255]